MLSNAPSIAQLAHAKQFRRDGVTPYIVHPMKVASFFEPNTFRWAAAWLHDVIEDTEWTVENLREQDVAEEVIEAVQILTRQGENYGEFIDRIIASGNDIAIDVKVADLLSNLSDKPRKYQLARYGRALAKLASVASSHIVYP